MPNNDYITRRNAINAACSDCYCCATIDEFEDTTCPVKQRFMSIPAADVEPSRRWIPVTDAENLPKRSTPCLVACNQWGGETVRKATWLASERIFQENGRDITEYVTHWMDSPRAPEEVRHAAP